MWEQKVGVCTLYVSKWALKKKYICALHVIQGTYFSDNYCVLFPAATLPYV
jgi:hypothetical protein